MTFIYIYIHTPFCKLTWMWKTQRFSRKMIYKCWVFHIYVSLQKGVFVFVHDMHKSKFSSLLDDFLPSWVGFNKNKTADLWQVLPSQKEALANECLDERFIAALRQVRYNGLDQWIRWCQEASWKAPAIFTQPGYIWDNHLYNRIIYQE